jgi:NADH-quinone oxidoreductase subunit H
MESFVVQAALQCAAMLFIFLVPGIYLWSWLDAKVGADMQARVGPGRSGAGGWLQPLADFLRLLQKVRPGSKADHGPALWWLQGVPLFALLSVTPVLASAPLLDTPFSALLSLFFALAFAWLGLLLSWRDGSVEPRFGSIRQMALAAAGFPSALLAFLNAGFCAGGLSWGRLEVAQGWAPWSWLALSGPFALVSSLVFLASGLLMFSARPFQPDLEPIAWIVAGFPGEAGIRLIWVRWSQRLGVFCWFLIGVKVFFGGASLPAFLGGVLGADAAMGAALGAAVVGLKTLTLLLSVSLLSRTLPAVRADQAHDFAWRVLCPLALLSLAGSQILGGGRG